MKVAYQILFVLLIVSCASTKSPYRVAHKYLEREPNYYKVGVWSTDSEWWIEIYDDRKTSWPFDEAILISYRTGQVDYVDIVSEKGIIYRYVWHLTEEKFINFYVVTLRDGFDMNSWQYYDSVVNRGIIPVHHRRTR